MADDADLFIDLLKNFGSFAEEKALSEIFGDPATLTFRISLPQ